MDKRYEIEITVISQKGKCVWGHKVGDKWLVSNTTPEGICLEAFYAMFADMKVLMFGGELPWSQNEDEALITCPDVANPVVFRIKRLR